MSQNMTIGAEGAVTNSVTLENVEEVRTRKVGEGGQVYIGKQYSGEEVLVAFRVQESEDENDVSDAEDTEN